MEILLKVRTLIRRIIFLFKNLFSCINIKWLINEIIENEESLDDPVVQLELVEQTIRNTLAKPHHLGSLLE